MDSTEDYWSGSGAVYTLAPGPPGNPGGPAGPVGP